MASTGGCWEAASEHRGHRGTEAQRNELHPPNHLSNSAPFAATAVASRSAPGILSTASQPERVVCPIHPSLLPRSPHRPNSRIVAATARSALADKDQAHRSVGRTNETDSAD